jgi:CheY-like chemotaxis protein
MASAAATTFDERAKPKRVVLVVEDEVIIRSVIADHLRDSGFTILEAANAAEAVTILTSRAPVDLVFSDITMPGSMDGFGLARWVHEHHSHIPVLLTSGAAAVLNAAGPFTDEAFMRKPYLPDELERRIRAMLD